MRFFGRQYYIIAIIRKEKGTQQKQAECACKANAVFCSMAIRALTAIAQSRPDGEHHSAWQTEGRERI
jgi:hypothetical protein